MVSLPLTDAERQRMLDLMAQQADRMQALVADLLTLAQLEGSPRPATDQWHDLDRVLAQAQADGQALSLGRHTIELDGASGAEVAGNRSELLSAVGNLVNNAVRYTHAGGRIGVRLAWRDGGGARGRGGRQRRGHRARAHPAADGALLPRGRQPLPRDRRHRAGPGDRQARGATAWRRTGDRERTRQGLTLQAHSAVGPLRQREPAQQPTADAVR